MTTGPALPGGHRGSGQRVLARRRAARYSQATPSPSESRP